MIIIPELAEDFKLFLKMVWGFLRLPSPTPIQYAIADYLQHGYKYQILEAFRGCGKSYITSVFVVWLLYRNPNSKILVVSAARDRADYFSTFTLRLINDIPFLSHLKPRTDQRESSRAFDVGPAKSAHQPSVKSVGITSSFTGSRADYIVADDIEVPENSFSPEMRDKIYSKTKEFFDIIMPGTGRITFLGTPQCNESIYNRLISDGYDCRIFPAIYPNQCDLIKYGDNLSQDIYNSVLRDPSISGKPTEISRFPLEVLNEKVKFYGRSRFALQFMLDTSLNDSMLHPLKCSDFIITPLNKTSGPVSISYNVNNKLAIKAPGFDDDYFCGPGEISKDTSVYESKFMAIDPSGKGDNLTSFVIVGKLCGKVFLLDIGGFTGGFEVPTLKALAAKAKSYGVSKIIIEHNFGGGMFPAILKPHLIEANVSAVVEEVQSWKQKEQRILETLEPPINSHRIVIDEAIVKRESSFDVTSLFYQLTHITKERNSLLNDDKIDVLSIAIADCANYLRVSEKESVKAFNKHYASKQINHLLSPVIDKPPHHTLYEQSRRHRAGR